MIAIIQGKKNNFRVDLSRPIDLGIPLRAGENNVNAFFIPPVRIEPFTADNFIGDVTQGGSCNVFSVSFNPHGNGTHTETVGHISKEKFPVYKSLDTFFFEAQLISIKAENLDGDFIITVENLKEKISHEAPQALIIRTLPNPPAKINRQYSGTNPVYLDSKAAAYLRDAGILHLILDVPSIDREDDGGKLKAHHEFWNYPASPLQKRTITELAYVPDYVEDGKYLLNLMVPSFDNDAAPSRPVLYAMIEDN
jgi:arylformamidase